MLDLQESGVPAQKESVFRLLMSGSDAPVFVLGRNKYAERVARVFSVQAFIDDYTGDKTYLDKPIIRMKELPRDATVISCVMDTLPVTALDKLQSAGFQKVIDYFMLSRLAPETFPAVDFCEKNRQDILENKAHYQRIYSLLSDDTSKEHFAKVVHFRLTLDLDYMRGLKLAIDRQYFENFLPEQVGEVFVDGGGFDGQTTLQYAARYQTFKRIYYFEPTPAMMEVSRRNLNGLRDVRLEQKGIFSRNDRLRFNTAAGPANSLSANGETEIEVVRLDDEVREPITFLKLDIEGAEHEAILGAAEHIRSSTPTLAVCIYHNQADFWRVPNRVLEINPNYKLFVRHYSESVRETVMFFVPAVHCL